MNDEMKLPEELDGMEILETLISPEQPNLGILIVGEDYYETSTRPVIRIYLIRIAPDEWLLENELEAFAFSNFESAKRFAQNFPNLSAIDLVLMMNGITTNHLSDNFVQ